MHGSKFFGTFQDGGRTFQMVQMVAVHFKMVTSQVPSRSTFNYNYMFVTLESPPKV